MAGVKAPPERVEATPTAAVEVLARLLAAAEARQLARDLDRRGGGFTAHAAAVARARADHWETEARWKLEALPERGDDGR